MTTFTLTTGQKVLAKDWGTHIDRTTPPEGIFVGVLPVKYSNRTQAEKSATKVRNTSGVKNASVIRDRFYFYVAIEEVVS